jgi:hypothetical protein
MEFVTRPFSGEKALLLNPDLTIVRHLNTNTVLGDILPVIEMRGFPTYLDGSSNAPRRDYAKLPSCITGRIGAMAQLPVRNNRSHGMVLSTQAVVHFGRI